MAVMAPTAAADAQVGLVLEDFEGWMAAEQRRVFLLCLRLLRNPEDANTAAQDAFFKAYRAIERGNAETLQDPSKWVTRIAVNTCLDLLRSRRWQFWRQRPPQDDEWTMLALAPSAAPTPERETLSLEIGRRMEQALNRLSARQRAVFILRHYEDKSLDDIASTLGLDVGTVKAHMSRALVKLRAELKDLYVD